MVNQKEWDIISGLIKPKPKDLPNLYDTDDKQRYFRLLGEKRSADNSVVVQKILKQNRSLEFKLKQKEDVSDKI
jgi:hypothetical protein